MPVLVEERLERLADPRAAVPVDDLRRGARERLVGVGGGQRARHARQPRAEAERLPAPVGPQRARAAKMTSARE